MRHGTRQDPSGEAAAAAQKHLTFYELDLGLNHVVRKWSDAVDNGANLLVPVPGGGDGPGGVLVCAENFVLYRNQDHEEVRAVIPRRADLPGDRGVLIVSYASHKKKAYSFFLLQSEYGDIYKVITSGSSPPRWLAARCVVARSSLSRPPFGPSPIHEARRLRWAC